MEQLEGSLDDFVLKIILDHLISDQNVENNFLELRCHGTRLKPLIDAILEERFCRVWNISHVTGAPPPSPTAFSTCRLSNFHHRHLVSLNESLSSIALKHGCDVGLIRRVNNIISDHTLASRDALYIPVQDASTIAGCSVSFEYHAAAHNRPMFVLHPPSSSTSAAAAQETLSESCTATGLINFNKSNALLQQMLQKTLAIDASTANYYLSASNWDPRAAIAACREDQRWDAKMKQLKRSLKTTTKLGKHK